MSRTPPLFLVFCGLLLAAAPARAQPDRAYVGTVRYVLRPENEPDIRHTVAGTVRFDLVETDDGTEHYAPTRVDVTWSVAGSVNNCVYSGSRAIVGEAPATYPNTLGSMDVSPSGGWYMGLAQMPLGTLLDAITVTCPSGEPYTINHTDHAVMITGFQDGLFDHDPEGDILRDTLVTAGQFGYLATFTWDLRRGQQEVELLVEPADYDRWIPAAGATEDEPGNTLAVAARLVSASGAPVEATRFRFALTDVSREPGVALNVPHPSLARTTPDLRLTEVTRESARDVADGQWIEADFGTEATATLTSYDWGAFGTLRVTATLPNGREVVGHLTADAAREAILLPRRADDSFVADAWKAAVGASGPDDADADAIPVGDDHDGDGLTLYEEYRGFVQDGAHLRTDPAWKDLFVLNSVGAPAAGGLRLFEALSGLAVHTRLGPGELDPDVRVINANHARGAHVVDQHGLWIKEVSGAVNRAVGGEIGTPRHTEYIRLAAVDWTARRRGGRRAIANDAASQAAHELLHGVNVWHHGERDRRDITWAIPLDGEGRLTVGPDGQLVVTEGGAPVEVRLEGGARTVPTEILIGDGGLPRPVRLNVGLPQGQHSGHEDCVMRYAVAQAYAPSASSAVRYWIGYEAERTGLGICRTPAGTGVNAPGRSPRPRYADADADAPSGRPDRGSCALQIDVNDAQDHPYPSLGLRALGPR